MKKLNKMNTRVVKTLSMSITLLLLPAAMLFAQIGDPPPPNGGGDPGIPIDGGLIFLLAVGIVYGAIKIYTAKLRKAE